MKVRKKENSYLGEKGGEERNKERKRRDALKRSGNVERKGRSPRNQSGGEVWTAAFSKTEKNCMNSVPGIVPIKKDASVVSTGKGETSWNLGGAPCKHKPVGFFGGCRFVQETLYQRPIM